MPAFRQLKLGGISLAWLTTTWSKGKQKRRLRCSATIVKIRSERNWRLRKERVINKAL